MSHPLTVTLFKSPTPEVLHFLLGNILKQFRFERFFFLYIYIINIILGNSIISGHTLLCGESMKHLPWLY